MSTGIAPRSGKTYGHTKPRYTATKRIRESKWLSYLQTIGLSSLMIAATLPLGAGTSSASESCVAIQPSGTAPYSAEDYLYPLSRRTNLVFLVKRQMKARGEYDYNIDHTYSDRLRDAVERVQREMDESATGCLTWSVVEKYDPKNRKHPVD